MNGLEVVVLTGEETRLRVGRLDQAAEWQRQIELWLSTLASANTQRAYRKAWQLLLAFTDKMPWEINRTDIAEWVASMKATGEQGKPLSPATIAQRIAAISSFYSYAMEEAEVVHPDGRTAPLYDRNPAAGKRIRPKVEPYDKAEGMSAEQAVAFLRAIVPNTVQGLRDRAMFRLYLATGRRNTEVRTLRKEQIVTTGPVVKYHWAGKRGSGWDEIPADIWADILKYLEESGRPWESLKQLDYVFVALTDSGKRFKRMQGREYDPVNQPLSERAIRDLVKKYARRAGLDPVVIHPHTLRHTTADMILETTRDVREVQQQLGHKNLNTSQIYMTKKQVHRNTFWAKFKAINDLE